MLASINAWLKAMFPEAPPYWQLVGSGSTGKPDLHLVLPGIDHPIAIIEVKTPKSLPTAAIHGMRAAIEEGRLHSSLDGTVVSGSEHQPRAGRAKICKVLDQMSISVASALMTLVYYGVSLWNC